MKKRKAQRAPAGSNGSTGARSRERRMICLDQEPLRREATTECSRALAGLEKLKKAWQRHQQEDLPAYARWNAVTFGPLLSRLRETEALLREKEALAREVEAEMFYHGARSYREAYARVDDRRKNPPKPEDAVPPEEPRHAPGDVEEEARPEGPNEFDPFEQEMIFEEFLRSVLGINPDRMSDAKYEKMFGEFRANFFGPNGASQPDSQRADDASGSASSRLKEIYRVLVRRLHPDTRADSNPAVAAIWHDVQEAYQTGNLERLEMLLALTEMQDSAPGEKTSLFQMRGVLEELRRASRALQKSLRSARKDPAWDFVRTGDRAGLRKKLQRHLEAALADRLAQLRELEHLLRQWAIPPKVRPSQKRKSQNQKGTRKLDVEESAQDFPRQADFSF